MATLVTGRMVEDRSITLSDLQTSGSFMFRNKIINGNFDIWQRGTSFDNIANNAYTADRWQIAYNGTGGTRTVSRQAFDLGQTSVLNEPTYYLRWNQTAADTSATFNIFRQKIESVRSLANKDIVVTFYAKAASPINIFVFGQQWYGTGGSPSSATNTNFPAGLNLTTSWQKFTVNLTVPSIAGKTLGTDNNDCFEIIFALPLNTTFTFDIAQVQVEEGTVATPFELRPIGTELQLCQRYFEKSYNVDVTPGTATQVGMVGGLGSNGSVSVNISPFIKFAVPKRTIPSITIWDSLGNINKIDDFNLDRPGQINGFTSNWALGVGWGFRCLSQNSFTLWSNQTPVGNHFFHYIASAEL